MKVLYRLGPACRDQPRKYEQRLSRGVGTASQNARLDSISMEERTADVVVALFRDAIHHLFGPSSDSHLGARDLDGDEEVMSVIKSCFSQSYVL